MSEHGSPAPRHGETARGRHTRPSDGFATPRGFTLAEGLESRAVELARTQCGVITLAQLLAVGFSPDQVERRARIGWLARLHEGVYALGTIGAIGKVQAGLIAGGPRSMADLYSSAALHDLAPYPDAVYIAVPRNGPRPPGLHVRRPTTLPNWTRRHGLRTATIPETLLALAAIDPTSAREATDQAFIHRRTDAAALTRFLGDKRGHRGVARLRAIIEGPRTRSGGERKFRRLLEQARLTDGWGSHRPPIKDGGPFAGAA